MPRGWPAADSTDTGARAVLGWPPRPPGLAPRPMLAAGVVAACCAMAQASSVMVSVTGPAAFRSKVPLCSSPCSCCNRLHRAAGSCRDAARSQRAEASMVWSRRVCCRCRPACSECAQCLACCMPKGRAPPGWLCVCPHALGDDAQGLADVSCSVLQHSPLVVQACAGVADVLVLQRLEGVPGVVRAAGPAGTDAHAGAADAGSPVSLAGGSGVARSMQHCGPARAVAGGPPHAHVTAVTSGLRPQDGLPCRHLTYHCCLAKPSHSCR